MLDVRASRTLEQNHVTRTRDPPQTIRLLRGRRGKMPRRRRTMPAIARGIHQMICRATDSQNNIDSDSRQRNGRHRDEAASDQAPNSSISPSTAMRRCAGVSPSTSIMVRAASGFEL